MKYYFFSITNSKISSTNQSPLCETSEYTHVNYGSANIYHRINGGVISHVMCEANSLEAAINTVEIFLSAR